MNVGLSRVGYGCVGGCLRVSVGVDMCEGVKVTGRNLYKDQLKPKTKVFPPPNPCCVL